MQHVLEQEHVLCTDNIQVKRNVRLIIARVVTSILANNLDTVEAVCLIPISGTNIIKKDLKWSKTPHKKTEDHATQMSIKPVMNSRAPNGKSITAPPEASADY
jgi:hypothetical protein